MHFLSGDDNSENEAYSSQMREAMETCIVTGPRLVTVHRHQSRVAFIHRERCPGLQQGVLDHWLQNSQQNCGQDELAL